jgi:1,4-dihydroxy-2-naphthoyl-CoA hydrolase
MFCRQFHVRLEDTDAAKLVFYPRIFHWAQESYEDLLRKKFQSLSTLLEEAPYLLPIGGCEGSYKLPLRFGDLVSGFTQVERLGETSFTLTHSYCLGDIQSRADISDSNLAAIAKVRHVCASRSMKKMPLPSELISLLKPLV